MCIFQACPAYALPKGVGNMRKEIADRCVEIGRYILRTGATVRQTAEVFSISKSTVHKDVHERLPHIHRGLYEEVQSVLSYHHDVRHIRGGAATQRRWRLLREAKTRRMTSAGDSYLTEKREKPTGEMLDRGVEA